MAGTDNHRNSGSRRVNTKIGGGVPSFNRNLSRHQLSCLLVPRLLSYVSSRRRRKTWTKWEKHFWVYGSTVYIGIAMVFVFSPYIREIQFLLSVSSQFDF